MLLVLNFIKSFISLYTGVLDPSVFHLCIRQLRVFIYYCINLNMLRFILAYKNKLEYGSTDSSYALFEMLLFINVGDVFRFSVGNTILFLSSYEFKNLKSNNNSEEFANPVDKGTTDNKNKSIYGISIDKLYALTCDFIGYIIILSIFAVFVSLLLFFIMHVIGFYTVRYKFLLYILFNFVVKFNLIFNSFLRSIGDRFGKSYISIVAAALQCSFPVFCYLWCNHVGYTINLFIVVLLAFLGSCISTTLNFINVYFIYNKRTLYPVFNGVCKRLRQTFYIFPGQILSSAFNFSFVDILMCTTPFNISEDMRLDIILAYKPLRNMYGMIILPLSTSLNLTAVQASNDKVFIKSIYATSLFIVFIGGLVTSMFIETQVYMKIFYIREMFTTNVISSVLYLFPLKLAGSVLGLRNILNSNNKFYNILIIMRDVSAILVFNLIYFYIPNAGVVLVFVYTLILQSLIAYCLNLLIAKYYDKTNDVSIIFDVMHTGLLFLAFACSYHIFGYIFHCLF